jgi:ATP-binding cassette subfamily C protein
MFAAARLALGYLTPRQRVTYFSLVIVRALTGFLDVFGIFLVGFIASVGAAQLSSSGGSGSTTILGIKLPVLTETDLVLLIVFVLVVFVGKAFLAIMLTRAMTSFLARIETQNAIDISELVLRGSLDDMKRYSKAQFQYAITSSTSALFTGILNNVATLFSEGFLLVVVVAGFFVVNPVAALFALGYFTIVIVAIQFFIGASIRRAGRDSASGTVDTTNALSDAIDSFREISVLSKQGLFLERLTESRGRLSRSAATFAFLGGMPRYVVETSLILGVVIFVGQQFLFGTLSSGIVTVGVFLTGGVRIMASLLPLQGAVTMLGQNYHQSAIAVELLDRERALALTAREAPEQTAIEVDRDHAVGVEVAGVRFRYPGDEADTLNDIALSVKPGSYVAIIGPSGAGKTTLVDLILGLISPDSGTVRIGGVEPVALRGVAPGLVSYVSQKPGLVSGSIAENVALGVRPDLIDHELVDASLRSAYLTDFVATLPEGTATSVGKQADALSGGQIQRIGLARALYAQPRFLILDEATSGLDAGSEAFIAESLKKLHGSVTVVVIAHRLSTVQHADLVHVVQDGRITASGSFASLRKSVPMVADYVKLMSFDDV